MKLVPDLYVLVAFEMLLVSITLLAIVKDLLRKRAERHSEATVEIVRGDKSMAPIYAVYASVTASSLVLINNSNGIEGYKALPIIINFFCFSYLLFFSTWFRNELFFKLVGMTKKI